MDKYKDIHSSVSSKKENINDLETLESFRQEFLGKKGSISLAMKEFMQFRIFFPTKRISYFRPK